MNTYGSERDGGDRREPGRGRRGPARLRLTPADDAGRWEPKMLGVATTGVPDPYGIFIPDARHHLHVLGPTGTGKSTLLVNAVLADAEAGRGVAVFDPKGDLVRDLLHRLPETAGGRLVLIDPDEKQAPAGLNLFELADTPEQVADQLVGVMAKVFAQHWGPRTDDLARQAVLTLAHLADATLADLPDLLQDKHFRRQVLARLRRSRGDVVQVQGLLGFWSWYEGLSDAAAAAQTGPLLARLRAVLTRSFAAQLFSAGASTFRLEDVLDGGVLLVRLPPTLGEDTVRLVGSLLLAALLHAANARADLAEHERLDCSVVLDEAHAFLHLPVGVDTALATARALHVSLVLAHQHLAQLTPAMVAAVDANARNKILFTLSPEDARVLARHTAPYLKPEHLTDREAFGIVCRLVINGRDADPFTLATRPAPPPVVGRAEQLRAAARARGLSAAERRAIAEARRLRPDLIDGSEHRPEEGGT